MNPYKTPGKEIGTCQKLSDFKIGIFDFVMDVDAKDFGKITTIVKAQSGHGYIFIDDDLVTKWWSINPVRDESKVVWKNQEIVFRYLWFPVFTKEVWINDDLLVRRQFAKISRRYYAMQGLGILLLVAVVIVQLFRWLN